MQGRRWLFAAAPVAAAAGLGGLSARRAPEVYRQLDKPRWAPPAAAFGPVWSALYLTAGAAGWRLFERASPPVRRLHLAQLALNAAWPAAFFGRRDKRAALAVIVLLDTALAAEVAALRRPDPVAAALLVPYLAWSAFATALNVAVSPPGGGPA